MKFYFPKSCMVLIAVVHICFPLLNMYGENIREIKIKRMELSDDVTLFSIINDAVSESNSKKVNDIRFFNVILNDIGKGCKVTVIGELDNRFLFYRNDIIGYCVLDSDTIILSGTTQYKPNYMTPSDVMSLKLESSDEFPGHYDPEEWFYFMIGDCYGRLVPKINWIWNIPNGSSLQSEEVIVTAPKRQSK